MQQLNRFKAEVNMMHMIPLTPCNSRYLQCQHHTGAVMPELEKA